jgi:hypothetical protein
MQGGKESVRGLMFLGLTAAVATLLVEPLTEKAMKVAFSQYPQPACNCNALAVAHRHMDNGIFPA